jgi:hypothetical protein
MIFYKDMIIALILSLNLLHHWRLNPRFTVSERADTNHGYSVGSFFPDDVG